MKILIVDDHRFIVEGLILDLKELKPDAEVTGCSVLNEIKERCLNEKWDVIFMDIDLSGANGISLVKQIMEIHPNTNIIYITGHENYALESYETNASAFLLKPITKKKLERALSSLRFPISGITDEYLAMLSSGNNMIGVKIKKYRMERNMSTEQLSRLLNVAVTTVFRWENGTRIPDTVTLMHIAKMLGVELTDLIQP